jgi:hypothetical protein
MSLVPLAPLIRSFRRSSSVTLTDLTVHLARSHGSIPLSSIGRSTLGVGCSTFSDPSQHLNVSTAVSCHSSATEERSFNKIATEALTALSSQRSAHHKPLTMRVVLSVSLPAFDSRPMIRISRFEIRN